MLESLDSVGGEEARHTEGEDGRCIALPGHPVCGIDPRHAIQPALEER